MPKAPAIPCGLVILGMLTLTACSVGPSGHDLQSTADQLAAAMMAQTQTAMPSDTQTATPEPSLTLAPSTTATHAATGTSTPRPTLGDRSLYLDLYFVPVGEEGPIGCGEELVPISTGVLRTGDPITDVRLALERLFASTGVQYQYGTYNALYGSSLTITSVAYEDEYGEIVVRTTGNINRGEAGCRWDQIRLMVRATTRSASPNESVEVRFNQHAFNDYVSGDR